MAPMTLPGSSGCLEAGSDPISSGFGDGNSANWQDRKSFSTSWKEAAGGNLFGPSLLENSLALTGRVKDTHNRTIQ